MKVEWEHDGTDMKLIPQMNQTWSPPLFAWREKWVSSQKGERKIHLIFDTHFKWIVPFSWGIPSIDAEEIGSSYRLKRYKGTAILDIDLEMQRPRISATSNMKNRCLGCRNCASLPWFSLTHLHPSIPALQYSSPPTLLSLIYLLVS